MNERHMKRTTASLYCYAFLVFHQQDCNSFFDKFGSLARSVCWDMSEVSEGSESGFLRAKAILAARQTTETLSCLVWLVLLAVKDLGMKRGLKRYILFENCISKFYTVSIHQTVTYVYFETHTTQTLHTNILYDCSLLPLRHMLEKSTVPECIIRSFHIRAF